MKPQQLTLTERIIAACSTRAGASLAEIKVALGRSDPSIGVMAPSLAKVGRLTSIGPSWRKRYFADPEHAAAAAPEAEKEVEAHRAAVTARRIAREAAKNLKRRQATEQRRLERAAQPKAPKQKQKPKKVARPFEQRILAAPVEIAKPKPRQEIVVPAGIQIQRGPNYTHDPRFQCAPDERVIGPFGLVGIGRDVTTGQPWR